MWKVIFLVVRKSLFIGKKKKRNLKQVHTIYKEKPINFKNM